MDNEPRRDTRKDDELAMANHAWFIHLSLMPYTKIRIPYPVNANNTQYLKTRTYLSWLIGDFLKTWIWDVKEG